MFSDRPMPRWYSRFKRVFQIFLLSYLAMLLLPTAGLLYLYHQVTLMAEQDCAQNAMFVVDEKAADLSTQLKWIDNTAGRFLLDTNVTNMLFTDPLIYGDARVSTFTAFSRHLSDKIGTYDASSLGYRFLFQNSELVFYSDTMSQGLEFVFNNTLTYDDLTYDEWYQAVFTPDHKTFIPAHTIHMGNASVRAVTYNYPIVRRKGSTTRKAVLQFFLPVADMIPDQAHPLSTVYLFTSDGTLLVTQGDDPLPAVPVLTSSDGWLRQKDGLLAYAEVIPGLTLAMLIPDEVAFRNVLAMRGPLLGMFLLCAVVEGVLSWYLARRTAQPIEHLAASMNEMVHLPRLGNEFEYLHRGVVQLQQDRASADLAAARSRQTELTMLMHRLLNYSDEDAEHLLSLGDRLGVSLRAEGYCVAVVALPPHTSAEMLPSLPPAPDGLQTICCEGHRDTLNILYLFASAPAAEMDQLLLAHLAQYLPLLPASSRIGVGRSYPALTDAAFSFGQAVFSLQAEEISAPIVQFDQITPALNSLCFPLDQQQRLFNAVKHNHAAVIDQEFDTLLQENTVKRHLSSLLKRTLLSSVEALLLMAAESVTQGENLSDYLRSIHHPEDFRTSLEVLREEFKRIAQSSGERFTQQSAGQRLEMQTYLEEHYNDPMLSIGSVADHFGFSESYFSVLFKELLGEPYSLYLEKLRLQKAGELLRTTSSSIEDIAVQVGYNNSTTFRRAFKRVRGVSPIQFRTQT